MKVYIVCISLFILLSNCSGQNQTQTSSTTEEYFEQENSKNEIDDGGLLSKKPCGPPCFLGIVPGISTESDVVSISKTFDVLSTCKIYDNRNQGGIKGMQCKKIYLGFTDTGLVDGLTYYPSIEITLGRIIEIYGSPSGVDVDRMSLPDSPSRLGMIFWYNNIQTKIFIEQNGDVVQINSDTPIQKVEYLSKNTYIEEINIFDNKIIEWKGYGTYTITEK